jgi:CheY-like chemotaxis protein
MVKKPAPIEILLAEDDSDDAILFSEAIKESTIHARLTWVEDGDKLLNYLNTEDRYQPDIIFLDINMPRRDGKECLKVMRMDSTLKDVPVVMFSTSLNEDDIAETFSAGANLYLCKRIFFENDISILQEIFKEGWRTQLQQRKRERYVLASTVFLSN